MMHCQAVGRGGVGGLWRPELTVAERKAAALVRDSPVDAKLRGGCRIAEETTLRSLASDSAAMVLKASIIVLASIVAGRHRPARSRARCSGGVPWCAARQLAASATLQRTLARDRQALARRCQAGSECSGPR